MERNSAITSVKFVIFLKLLNHQKRSRLKDSSTAMNVKFAGKEDRKIIFIVRLVRHA